MARRRRRSIPWTHPLPAVLLLLAGLACRGTGSAPAIVTADGRVTPVADFRTRLEAVVSDLRRSDSADNLILFIHGRGRHPGKAFRQGLLTGLESDYGARVLMFHWPSWTGVLGFPEAQARRAAPDLIRVLNDLAAYRDDPAQALAGIRLTLLTQSMGSLVLEAAVRAWPTAAMPRLFDTLILSAPASASRGHRRWLDRLTLSDHVYVTAHRHDPVLACAALRTHSPRLGQHLPPEAEALSPRAVYLDVTRAWVAHRYYLHRYLVLAPSLRACYDRILNGRPLESAPPRGFVSAGHPRTWRLTGRIPRVRPGNLRLDGHRSRDDAHGHPAPVLGRTQHVGGCDDPVASGLPEPNRGGPGLGRQLRGPGLR